jgi:hypothetical protein
MKTITLILLTVSLLFAYTDSISIKEPIWIYNKYKIGNGNYTNIYNFFGTINNNLWKEFDTNSQEYDLINKGKNSKIISNVFYSFFVITIGIYLAEELLDLTFVNDHNKYAYLGIGSASLAIDIIFNIKSSKYITKAINLRNTSLNK